MARLFKSYFQSDFGSEHKNFEAVVLEGSDLNHWWRDNSLPWKPWRRAGPIVSQRAVFPASMIQSDFGSGGHGNFEVVAALHDKGGKNVELWHLWHRNDDMSAPWSFGQRITEPGRRVAGPASLIQSDFRPGKHGNFEVAVPILGDDGNVELRHYWHDNSDVRKRWAKGQRINDPSHRVMGGGCLIQSDFSSAGHGNFEVVAWVLLPDGTSMLQHYWHDNADVRSPWRTGQVIATGVAGNGVIIQSSFGSPSHGNFEVIVPIARSDGRTNIQHFWRDNTDVTLPWRPGQRISEVGAADASACLFESDYRDGDHGSFELLFDEAPQSLVEWRHPLQNGASPWVRNTVLIREPPARIVTGTQRICQLTGEYDRTGWDGNGQPPYAFNRTESRWGQRGMDLGASFEHKNRLYFLFGDTWRTGETKDTYSALDSIAFCTDTQVKGGLSLTFYKQEPRVPGIDQGGFNVPLDGFSYGRRMFVFFSTAHYKVGDAELMGRSVLAVSDNDGYDFRALTTFSRRKFMNVSVEQAQLSRELAAEIGWDNEADILWIWGSGAYRASPPYLALLNVRLLLNALDEGRAPAMTDITRVPGSAAFLRFYAAGSTGTRWSPSEEDAEPLLAAGDIGELSCRWNAIFASYFLTYNSGSPRGIVLRQAPQPWGPWSGPILIFDPYGNPHGDIKDGYGRFMHIPWDVARVDHVQDDMFLDGMRDTGWGAEYGAYQIPRYATGEPGRFCDLYYVMSTWNPYQAVLMRTRLTSADLGR